MSVHTAEITHRGYTVKYYKLEIERLLDLTPEERTDELLTRKLELGAFLSFLQEMEEQTNEPETYSDLLTELTAYYAYGLEMIGEAVGVDVDTPTEEYINTLEIVKALESKSLIS